MVAKKAHTRLLAIATRREQLTCYWKSGRVPRVLNPLKFLAIERCPGKPPWTIIRFGLVQFDRSEVGGTTGEIVIDRGQKHASIDRLASCIQTEIQVHGVIHAIPLCRVGR